MALRGDVVGESRAERFAAAERRIGRMTHLLDELIEVPGTSIKLGLDPVIGLIPVAGDALSALAGGWVILEASRFGLPRVVLARMVVNLALDLGIGAIPLLGDAYDLLFRSNSRNLELFRKHALDPAASTRGEQALFIGLGLLIVGIVWLVVMAMSTLVGWLGSTRI
ncbi:MAG TPA: DUF4112 domain-containing protein [Candidatus Limnocylindrales bacterium]